MLAGHRFQSVFTRFSSKVPSKVIAALAMEAGNTLSATVFYSVSTTCFEIASKTSDDPKLATQAEMRSQKSQFEQALANDPSLASVNSVKNVLSVTQALIATLNKIRSSSFAPELYWEGSHMAAQAGVALTAAGHPSHAIPLLLWASMAASSSPSLLRPNTLPWRIALAKSITQAYNATGSWDRAAKFVHETMQAVTSQLNVLLSDPAPMPDSDLRALGQALSWLEFTQASYAFLASTVPSVGTSIDALSPELTESLCQLVDRGILPPPIAAHMNSMSITVKPDPQDDASSTATSSLTSPRDDTAVNLSWDTQTPSLDLVVSAAKALVAHNKSAGTHVPYLLAVAADRCYSQTDSDLWLELCEIAVAVNQNAWISDEITSKVPDGSSSILIACLVPGALLDAADAEALDMCTAALTDSSVPRSLSVAAAKRLWSSRIQTLQPVVSDPTTELAAQGEAEWQADRRVAKAIFSVLHEHCTADVLLVSRAGAASAALDESVGQEQDAVLTYQTVERLLHGADPEVPVGQSNGLTTALGLLALDIAAGIARCKIKVISRQVLADAEKQAIADAAALEQKNRLAGRRRSVIARQVASLSPPKPVLLSQSAEKEILADCHRSPVARAVTLMAMARALGPGARAETMLSTAASLLVTAAKSEAKLKTNSSSTVVAPPEPLSSAALMRKSLPAPRVVSRSANSLTIAAPSSISFASDARVAALALVVRPAGAAQVSEPISWPPRLSTGSDSSSEEVVWKVTDMAANTGLSFALTPLNHQGVAIGALGASTPEVSAVLHPPLLSVWVALAVTARFLGAGTAFFKAAEIVLDEATADPGTTLASPPAIRASMLNLPPAVRTRAVQVLFGLAEMEASVDHGEPTAVAVATSSRYAIAGSLATTVPDGDALVAHAATAIQRVISKPAARSPATVLSPLMAAASLCSLVDLSKLSPEAVELFRATTARVGVSLSTVAEQFGVKKLIQAVSSLPPELQAAAQNVASGLQSGSPASLEHGGARNSRSLEQASADALVASLSSEHSVGDLLKMLEASVAVSGGVGSVAGAWWKGMTGEGSLPDRCMAALSALKALPGEPDVSWAAWAVKTVAVAAKGSVDPKQLMTLVDAAQDFFDLVMKGEPIMAPPDPSEDVQPTKPRRRKKGTKTSSDAAGSGLSVPREGSKTRRASSIAAEPDNRTDEEKAADAAAAAAASVIQRGFKDSVKRKQLAALRSAVIPWRSALAFYRGYAGSLIEPCASAEAVLELDTLPGRPVATSRMPAVDPNLAEEQDDEQVGEAEDGAADDEKRAGPAISRRSQEFLGWTSALVLGLRGEAYGVIRASLTALSKRLAEFLESVRAGRVEKVTAMRLAIGVVDLVHDGEEVDRWMVLTMLHVCQVVGALPRVSKLARSLIEDGTLYAHDSEMQLALADYISLVEGEEAAAPFAETVRRDAGDVMSALISARAARASWAVAALTRDEDDMEDATMDALMAYESAVDIARSRREVDVAIVAAEESAILTDVSASRHMHIFSGVLDHVIDVGGAIKRRFDGLPRTASELASKLGVSRAAAAARICARAHQVASSAPVALRLAWWASRFSGAAFLASGPPFPKRAADFASPVPVGMGTRESFGALSGLGAGGAGGVFSAFLSCARELIGSERGLDALWAVGAAQLYNPRVGWSEELALAQSEAAAVAGFLGPSAIAIAPALQALSPAPSSRFGVDGKGISSPGSSASQWAEWMLQASGRSPAVERVRLRWLGVLVSGVSTVSWAKLPPLPASALEALNLPSVMASGIGCGEDGEGAPLSVGSMPSAKARKSRKGAVVPVDPEQGSMAVTSKVGGSEWARQVLNMLKGALEVAATPESLVMLTNLHASRGEWVSAVKVGKSALEACNKSWRATQGGSWAECALAAMVESLMGLQSPEAAQTLCQLRRSSVKVLAAGGMVTEAMLDRAEEDIPLMAATVTRVCLPSFAWSRAWAAVEKESQDHGWTWGCGVPQYGPQAARISLAVRVVVESGGSVGDASALLKAVHETGWPVVGELGRMWSLGGVHVADGLKWAAQLTAAYGGGEFGLLRHLWAEVAASSDDLKTVRLAGAAAEAVRTVEGVFVQREPRGGVTSVPLVSLPLFARNELGATATEKGGAVAASMLLNYVNTVIGEGVKGGAVAALRAEALVSAVTRAMPEWATSALPIAATNGGQGNAELEHEVVGTVKGLGLADGTTDLVEVSLLSVGSQDELVSRRGVALPRAAVSGALTELSAIGKEVAGSNGNGSRSVQDRWERVLLVLFGGRGPHPPAKPGAIATLSGILDGVRGSVSSVAVRGDEDIVSWLRAG